MEEKKVNFVFFFLVFSNIYSQVDTQQQIINLRCDNATKKHGQHQIFWSYTQSISTLC